MNRRAWVFVVRKLKLTGQSDEWIAKTLGISADDVRRYFAMDLLPDDPIPWHRYFMISIIAVEIIRSLL